MNKTLRKLSEKEIMVRCDASCKEILSNKDILARILKYTIKEFADADVDFIRDVCIEGDSIWDGSDMTPLSKKSRLVTGMNSNSTIVGEGEYAYDVLFHAVVPTHKGRSEKYIMDVEGQNRYNPGYILESRGIFYTSRMISSQYGREFSGSNYDAIKKVYSIWICMNPEVADINTVTSYAMVKEDIVGSAVDRKKSYDKISVIKICLGGEQAEQYDNYTGVIRMLDVIFSERLLPEQKLEILNREFGIRTESVEEEIKDMCNISEYYYETGMKRGITQGISQGIAQGITQGITQGELQATIQMGYDYGIPKAEIIERIMQKFSFTREDAVQRVNQMWG